nr:hypothetical protein [uncultured Moellerella sp.]
MKKIWLAIALLLLTSHSFAECDFTKAARNEVLNKKIGISGNCDTTKAVKTQTTKKVDEKLDINSKQLKENTQNKKDNIQKDVKTSKKMLNAVK